jgi:serine/threonine protein kinase/ABC-type branched-subunit amino acid transport system substrate-binding protein
MIGSPSMLSNSGADPARTLLPGSRLQGGRYLIKSVLGQGGMGAALLATDIRLDGKLVVIKELISDNVDQSKRLDDVRNFKREVATLAHIDHPLVPNVTDHFQEGTRYFMVQEYVDGENLEQRLERSNAPMKERDALICASEILDILDYLSQQTPPIVHRDIKPANIIIGTKDKRAHLVDFGIARADEAKNAKRKQTAALGTPGYAPPEQYQGNADPRSDLYALAATLHHVLTNHDPRNHSPFSYPPVRSLNPQLTVDIERVLTRSLNNDINQRYQSAVAMKQDIDAILRLHFGVSGAIDSYTLGSSGSTGAVPVITMANISSQITQQTNPPQWTPMTQSTAGQSTITPVQPLSSLNPGPPSFPGNSVPGTMGSVSAVPQLKRPGTRFILLAAILALLLVVCGVFISRPSLLPTSSSSNSTHIVSSLAPSISVNKMGNEYIGISDGSFAFDTTLQDGALKTQAAQLLRQSNSDPNTVISLLNQAVALTPNDAEAHIYLEDLRVMNSGSKYVTLVVGTMLSGDPTLITVGRDDLQGAYIAQKEYNDASKLYNGLQVRLLIANSGSQTLYVQDVAQQIVQLAQSDKTFMGVIGWPYSSRALNEVKVLGNAHIPMMSQTASSDALTNVSPYFFRVVPSNQSQGIQGTAYVQQSLHAKRVALFYDPGDSYSQSLAQDFKQSFVSAGGQIVVTETYTVGKPGTLPTVVSDALAHNPDLIYFSGYASDVSTLLSNLPVGNNIPVMGGDALYELGGYQSTARANFSHLRFTAFAYPDEWDVLGYSGSKPAFFSEYPAAYNPASLPNLSYGFTRADNDVILSYDATVALLTGCNGALSTGKSSITSQDVVEALKAINGPKTFQGVSGQIAFGSNGDPMNKAIVVLYVDATGHIHMEPTILGRFLK